MPTKLQKTEEGQVVVEVCKIVSSKTSDIDMNNDIFIDLKKFSEIICKCNQCKKLYKDKNLEFLEDDFYTNWINRESLEEKIIEEVEKDTVNNTENLNTLENVDMFQIEEVKNLTVEKVKIYYSSKSS